MGCDIHMYVEYNRTGKEERDWLCGDYFRVVDPLAVTPSIKRIALYGDRNYALFAVLADVRNSNLNDYIAEPRGLPDDATEFVRREYAAWGSDAHSCSYFTLQELIDYHEKNKPQDSTGRYVLKPLIDRLKQRANELDLIWDFEWHSASTREIAYKRSDRIRIVFWFDN